MPAGYSTALIIGAGVGISASLARALAREGLKVGLAARNSAKLAELATETGASVFSVDASGPAAVSRLVVDVDTRLGEPDVVRAVRGPIPDKIPQGHRATTEGRGGPRRVNVPSSDPQVACSQTEGPRSSRDAASAIAHAKAAIAAVYQKNHSSDLSPAQVAQFEPYTATLKDGV